MIKLAPALSALALAATPAPPQAAQPFDPAELQQAVQEQPTELLILGSSHLAELGSSFDVAWLQPLLAALERFGPAAIVVEALPTEALHHLVAYEALYPGVADMFARTRLRLSAEASVEAERSPALAAARAGRPEPQFTAMTAPERVLAAYREHNSAQAGRRDAERQWLARLESGEHGHVHRRRIAGWETRNLRMAANIREASASYPGKRILVLVGSAHKPFLEAYLRPMSDVRLVPAAGIIGGGE
jgi:hypothetical protein